MFWILFNKSDVHDVHNKDDGHSKSNTNHEPSPKQVVKKIIKFIVFITLL